MPVEDMKALRQQAGLTQAEMADLMGLGKTAYVDLELGDPDWKKFKSRHQLALERASMKLAVERGDITLALPAVRRDALDLARLITGDYRASGFTGWLMDQVDRDDPVGTLARDARDDPKFPDGSPGMVLDYLSSAKRRGGRECLLEALEEYLP